MNKKQIVIFPFKDIIDDITSNDISSVLGETFKFSYKIHKNYLRLFADNGGSTITIEIPINRIVKFYQKNNWEIVDYQECGCDKTKESLMMW